MAFLLVVVVSGEIVSDDRMLFRDVFRCNVFSWANESGATGLRARRFRAQENVTAYCIPKMVNRNTELFE